MSENLEAAGRGTGRRPRGLGPGAATALVLAGSLLTGCMAGVVGPGGVAATTSSPTPSPSPSVDHPVDEPTSGASPQPTAVPAATREPTPIPEAVLPATPGPASAPPPEAAPAPAPTAEVAALARGAEGPAVLALQQRLAELGYFVTGADGRFGAATQQAVWALQKAAGLARDGLVGPATQAALDAGARPAPRTTSGRVIEIDLDRQLLLTVEDGVVTRVVNASSGNGDTYEALGRLHRATTPTGDHTLVREIDAMHESTLELGSMYRPKYFRGGWAVHGSGSIPPWPASHGCVRVSNAAMDWIWDVWTAPLGTRVLVY